MTTKFYIVDTFSKDAFHGSPTAVFLVDDLSNEELLQNMAIEINTPESIFIKELQHGDFEIVCFCQSTKGMFFGNGLFAAAEVIYRKQNKLTTFNFICGNKIYQVDHQDNKEIKIKFSTLTLNKVSMPSSLTSALDGELVVSIAECKNDLIVEIRSPKRVFNLIPNMDILKGIDYNLIILTADTHYETEVDYDFCAKVFAPKLGIFNDIISPFAHVKLAAYWVDRMEKNEFIGHQASEFRTGYSKVSYGEEFTYISGNCIISATGEMNSKV